MFPSARTTRRPRSANRADAHPVDALSLTAAQSRLRHAASMLSAALSRRLRDCRTAVPGGRQQALPVTSTHLIGTGVPASAKHPLSRPWAIWKYYSHARRRASTSKKSGRLRPENLLAYGLRCTSRHPPGQGSAGSAERPGGASPPLQPQARPGRWRQRRHATTARLPRPRARPTRPTPPPPGPKARSPGLRTGDQPPRPRPRGTACSSAAISITH